MMNNIYKVKLQIIEFKLYIIIISNNFKKIFILIFNNINYNKMI